MATTIVDGVEIAYDVTGSGPGLVLVHGITQCRQMWDPLIGDLATDHTVVAIDMRGHGASGRAATYDNRVMAEDVAAVVAVEGLDAPLVVGHSMGGIVVTAYAATHPSRGVLNVDQSLALGDFQELVRAVEPMLRGDEFHTLVTSFIDSLQGVLSDAEAERIAGLRQPVQEVVLGVWGPVLELSLEELDGLVRSLTADVRVPYLALPHLDRRRRDDALQPRRVVRPRVAPVEGEVRHAHVGGQRADERIELLERQLQHRSPHP